MVHVSVIGCGNMGSALVRGLARNGTHTVTACDVDPQALEAISELCSNTTTDLETAAAADIIFSVVKPDITASIVEDLDLSAEQTLVSIAAGVSTDVLEARTDATVVRLMPNLAAESGNMAGAIAGDAIDDDVVAVLEEVGVVVEIDEERMDTATAVNGSGPAFVFYLLNAVKQAGVSSGLDPEKAEILAAQTFKGAAETVLRDDRSTDELIEAVCSPKGTTIEGMNVLRESTVEETVEAAVIAAEERSSELAEEVSNE